MSRIGLWSGPAFAALLLLLLPEQFVDGTGQTVDFAWTGRVAAASAAWMAVWWMTEAIPVYATALLPLVLFPMVGGMGISEAARPYSHELIFLFLGGFMLAQCLQKWGLHRRIAYSALSRVGTSPARIVAAFMVISAGTSMWVTNTAATMMLLPVVLSVIALLHRDGDGAGHNEAGAHAFAVCLLLGTAYAASIGGVATIIGSPPNVFVVSYAESQLGREISFVRWMMFGVPLVIIFIPVAWWLLTRCVYRLDAQPVAGADVTIRRALAELGPMGTAEWRTAIVFAATATLWVTRPLLQQIEIAGVQPLAGLSDPGIAIAAALALFVLPGGEERGQRLLDWHSAAKLPWGLLVLFGGGLSLAAAMDGYGVSAYIGTLAAGLGGLPSVLIVLGVITLVKFLTELTSNTATTATLVPILAAIAPVLGLDAYHLIVPAAIAASYAFMLPVATPPNAIVFGSGHVTIREMTRAGFWLNIVGALGVTALTYVLIVPVLGA